MQVKQNAKLKNISTKIENTTEIISDKDEKFSQTLIQIKTI